MTAETPMVTADLPGREGRVRVDAQLLGPPTRTDGKPVMVELLLGNGRYTTAEFKKVEAINEAAKLLLEAPGPERAAKA